MKTIEDLCEEWLRETFDESELPEHEKSKPSELATHMAMARLGFMACHREVTKRHSKRVKLYSNVMQLFVVLLLVVGAGVAFIANNSNENSSAINLDVQQMVPPTKIQFTTDELDTVTYTK